MNKMDYTIFVPRGENNHVRFNTEKEFEIEDFISINIYTSDDKVMYWFYVKIPLDDMHHKTLLGKGRKPNLTLLIGNNPYEIKGNCEVINTSIHQWEQQIEVNLCFTVINASKTVENKRKLVSYDRSELLDLRED
jgi:hypothetical protein